MMEHRHHTRAPIELEVGYKRLNSFFAEYTRNISKGGTFIKTKKPLPIGAKSAVFTLAASLLFTAVLGLKLFGIY